MLWYGAEVAWDPVLQLPGVVPSIVQRENDVQFE